MVLAIWMRGIGLTKLTIVVNDALVVQSQSVKLSAERFEKGTATSPGTAQDKEQLATLECSVEVM